MAVLNDLLALAGAPRTAARQEKIWSLLVQPTGLSAAADDAADFAALVEQAAAQPDLLPADPARLVLQHQARRDSRVWINPQDGSEMIWIAGGPFLWGEARRRDELAGFSLARHPITNRQYHRFLLATGYVPDPAHPRPDRYLPGWRRDGDGDETSPAQGAPIEPAAGHEDHPVTGVSLVDAGNYCAWAGLVLPSQWMWEKAARGTDGRTYPWGEAAPSRALANLAGKGTCPVGTYPRIRTAYGCQDMVGNVAELCLLGEHGTVVVAPPVKHLADLRDSRAQGRGSDFSRSGKRRADCAHQRQISATGRNRWLGFRPAFAPTF